VIQPDSFNSSRIGTVVVAVITSNLHLAKAPGNVRLTQQQTNLARESVANVSQVITLDQIVGFLGESVSARCCGPHLLCSSPKCPRRFNAVLATNSTRKTTQAARITFQSGHHMNIWAQK